MICIQTPASKPFLKDIHRLIKGEQFGRVPIVWLNPSLLPGRDSRMVYRDGAEDLIKGFIY